MSSTIRGRRRRSGKAKAERRERRKHQQELWDRLTYVEREELDSFKQFRSVLIPMIRKILPMQFAKQLVGVQPMTGPTSDEHTLKVRYTAEEDTERTEEAETEIAGCDVDEIIESIEVDGSRGC